MLVYVCGEAVHVDKISHIETDILGQPYIVMDNKNRVQVSNKYSIEQIVKEINKQTKIIKGETKEDGSPIMKEKK